MKIYLKAVILFILCIELTACSSDKEETSKPVNEKPWLVEKDDETNDDTNMESQDSASEEPKVLNVEDINGYYLTEDNLFGMNISDDNIELFYYAESKGKYQVEMISQTEDSIQLTLKAAIGIDDVSADIKKTTDGLIISLSGNDVPLEDKENIQLSSVNETDFTERIKDMKSSINVNTAISNDFMEKIRFTSIYVKTTYPLYATTSLKSDTVKGYDKDGFTFVYDGYIDLIGDLWVQVYVESVDTYAWLYVTDEIMNTHNEKYDSLLSENIAKAEERGKQLLTNGIYVDVTDSIYTEHDYESTYLGVVAEGIYVDAVDYYVSDNGELWIKVNVTTTTSGNVTGWMIGY